MRGGLGVRKRLSEESQRPSYRLNGVRTGMAVARCYDKYGRWEGGYTVGVIVRKTSSIVQIRWADTPDEITTHDQGDARYEVERGRWRILGLMQGNPLDPDNSIAVALTALRESARMGHRQNAGTPMTEENEVTKQISNAEAERQAAKKALAEGNLKEREVYTAKQVATRCGTDAKTMRKFFRSSSSTVEPVGQGGRYEFDAKDLPKIKKEFNSWQKRAQARSTRRNNTKRMLTETHSEPETKPQEIEEPVEEREEPTEEELMALEDEELDLDDIDEDED